MFVLTIPGALAPPALAQTAAAPPIPELGPPADKRPAPAKPVPAKKLFGAKTRGAALKARAIGYYSRGCLSGGQWLPVDGPAWQAMRLSRNRNWGHPVLVDLVKRLATEAKAAGDWPGLLVGDLTQPRGGPMLTGHASHQVGLDADIWLTPMPDRRFTYTERERVSAVSMLKNTLEVNEKVFTPNVVALIKRAASFKEVERIGVNPAIKLALCRAAGGDKPWLGKIQGWRGHHYHMHIRIKCPPGSDSCRSQGKPKGTSCAVAEKWYADTKAWMEKPKTRPKTKKKRKKRKPKPPLTLADLPQACRDVLAADDLGGPEPIKNVLLPEAKPGRLSAAIAVPRPTPAMRPLEILRRSQAQ
ncbi:MAG: penicillin-insensitive murein endopeptidase [Alphaproteobacteria bacterium]|nr:penicillin-insensitive murein endopeptidase [Alphaproteobacteria bacterium]